MHPLLDESWDSFDRLFAVNVKGMFFLLQAVARQMVEQGRGGKIINLSSQAGRRGEALVAHYCATKAAVISYTQSAALALAPHGINVNGIAPAWWIPRCGRMSTRCLPATKAASPARKNAWWAKPCRWAAWACRKT
jgi:NAD(P)-dependent dehydrogenase (short-subunit alcohol dehydrogenase family)